jgi:serine/threonine protein kinase
MSFEVIFESPASTVYKTSRVLANADGSSSERVLAVKTGCRLRAHTPEPHDIVKEARLLARLAHPNVSAHAGCPISAEGACEIIDVVHAGADSVRADMFSIWMPFCGHTLEELLDSPRFAPSHPFSTTDPERSNPDFTSTARAVIRQILSAIAYLHDPAQGIAHRDIKPRNFLIDDGCVKLIDFGISYDMQATERHQDLWPERPDELYTQVSTGCVALTSFIATVQ